MDGQGQGYKLIEIFCWFIACWLIYKQLTKFKISYIVYGFPVSSQKVLHTIIQRDTISIYSPMNPGCPLYLKKSVTDWNLI